MGIKSSQKQGFVLAVLIVTAFFTTFSLLIMVPQLPNYALKFDLRKFAKPYDPGGSELQNAQDQLDWAYERSGREAPILTEKDLLKRKGPPKKGDKLLPALPASNPTTAPPTAAAPTAQPSPMVKPTTEPTGTSQSPIKPCFDGVSTAVCFVSYTRDGYQPIYNWRECGANGCFTQSKLAADLAAAQLTLVTDGTSVAVRPSGPLLPQTPVSPAPPPSVAPSPRSTPPPNPTAAPSPPPVIFSQPLPVITPFTSAPFSYGLYNAPSINTAVSNANAIAAAFIPTNHAPLSYGYTTGYHTGETVTLPFTPTASSGITGAQISQVVSGAVGQTPSTPVAYGPNSHVWPTNYGAPSTPTVSSGITGAQISQAVSSATSEVVIAGHPWLNNGDTFTPTTTSPAANSLTGWDLFAYKFEMGISGGNPYSPSIYPSHNPNISSAYQYSSPLPNPYGSLPPPPDVQLMMMIPIYGPLEITPLQYMVGQNASFSYNSVSTPAFTSYLNSVYSDTNFQASNNLEFITSLTTAINTNTTYNPEMRELLSNLQPGEEAGFWEQALAYNRNYDTAEMITSGQGICYDFAAVGNYILGQQGIHSQILSSVSLDHAFLEVQIDNTAYIVDPTWGIVIPKAEHSQTYKVTDYEYVGDFYGYDIEDDMANKSLWEIYSQLLATNERFNFGGN